MLEKIATLQSFLFTHLLLLLSTGVDKHLEGRSSSCIDSAGRKEAREGRRQGRRTPSGVSTMPSLAELQTMTCPHQRQLHI